MMTQHTGRVLSIAGSDSGGGAGIQADIKTITALGGYAMSAITSITAQNTQEVRKVETLSPVLVEQQVEAVLDDIGADVIKTGMLANENIIHTVANLAKRYRTIPLVVDPVMVSTSGHELLEKDAFKAMKEVLFPHALLITPNIPEAELLAHVLISGEEGMTKAAQIILKDTKCDAVLIKGGHLKKEKILDILVLKSGDTVRFTSDYVDTKHTHGTGCTLASAIATQLAQGDTLKNAIKTARYYVHKAIITAPKFGKGNGPLNHGWPLKH